MPFARLKPTVDKWASATLKEPAMTINVITFEPLVALVAGILILLIPRLLNIIVAIYLIVIGIAGLLPHLHMTQ